MCLYGYLRQAKPAAWKERFEDLEDKDNDSEDYEDYKKEDRNNIDLDDFIEEEKEEILEEFEEEMLWKRASCKAAKKPNNLIGNLLDYLLNFCFVQGCTVQHLVNGLLFLSMVKKFLQDGHKSCLVDFFVPTINEDQIHSHIVNKGNFFALAVAMPDFFCKNEPAVAVRKTASANLC